MPWSGILHADTFDPWPEPRSVHAGSRTEPPFRFIRTRNINPAFLSRDDDIRGPDPSQADSIGGGQPHAMPHLTPAAWVGATRRAAQMATGPVFRRRLQDKLGQCIGDGDGYEADPQ
jgi:hypothetical protein